MPEPDFVLSRRWGTFRLPPSSQVPFKSIYLDRDFDLGPGFLGVFLRLRSDFSFFFLLFLLRSA